MGLILEMEESGFSGFIEDGTILGAQVMSVKLKEKPFKDKETGEPIRKIEFHFKLVSDDAHDGQDIWGETSTKFNDHPECRLRQWSEALLGRRLPPHYRLDLDELQDRRCRVVVAKKEYDKNGETKVRNFVREVHPTREAATALAADYDDPF